MTSLAHDRYKLVQVTSVEVLHDHVVRLGFSDGCVGEIDLRAKLHGPIFQPLADDQDLFCQVRADGDLGTIAWPNGADMAPEVLHAETIAHCPHPATDTTPLPIVHVELDAAEAKQIVGLLCDDLQRLLDAGYDVNRDWQAGTVAGLLLDLIDQVAEQGVTIEVPDLAAATREQVRTALESTAWGEKLERRAEAP